MNWKDTPHLFANGKFKAMHKNIDDEIILGIVDNVLFRFPQSKNENCKDCQLIARPISDITDEENEKFIDLVNEHIDFLLDNIDKEIIYEQNPKQLLYLLSIGVYPFDDDTDVIFKPKTQE